MKFHTSFCMYGYIYGYIKYTCMFSFLCLSYVFQFCMCMFYAKKKKNVVSRHNGSGKVMLKHHIFLTAHGLKMFCFHSLLSLNQRAYKKLSCIISCICAIRGGLYLQGFVFSLKFPRYTYWRNEILHTIGGYPNDL